MRSVQGTLGRKSSESPGPSPSSQHGVSLLPEMSNVLKKNGWQERSDGASATVHLAKFVLLETLRRDAKARRRKRSDGGPGASKYKKRV